MKTILFLISIFFSLQVLGQNDSLPKFDTIETLCEKGEKLAIQVADSGIYQIYSFGYPIMSPKDWDYSAFYSHYLKKKYNVDYSHRGCVVFTNEQCYSNKMKELILIKYGDDFFERAEKEAKEEYIKSVQIKIDTGFIFKAPDSMPQYIGGEDSMFMYLDRSCRLYNSVDKRGCSNPNGTVYCRFIVEKDGSITNYKIVRSLDLTADNKVLESMRKMPNWKPATINNQPVRCTMVLPFKFSQK